jgi:hypothetical protein
MGTQIIDDVAAHGSAVESTMSDVKNQLMAGVTEIIDPVHAHVHEGIFFSGGHYNAAVANNGNLDLLIQTSALYPIHIVFSIAAGAECTYQIFEGTTFSNAGTAIAMNNHNRLSVKTFNGTVTHTPTVTVVGTAINSVQYVAAGPNGALQTPSGGSSEGFSFEFILDVSQSYLVRVTNISGGATRVALRADCYQVGL